MSAAEILAAHARRPVRAFLRNADVEAEGAFWRLVYADRPQVDPATALSVHNEILNCPRPVQDVLDGWRPAALNEQPVCPHCCDRHRVDSPCP